MNRRLPTAATTLLVALMLAPGPARAAVGVADAHGFRPHELILKLAGSKRARTVELPRQSSVGAAVAALRDNPTVAYATPNYIATASAGEDEAITTSPTDPGTISAQPGPRGGWVYKHCNFPTREA